jgi:hypothetical protein
VSVWTFSAGSFTQASSSWAACGRFNGTPPDSIGVSLSYRYDFQTALGNVLRFFGGGGTTWSSVAISDRTVMAMNPTD